MTRLLRCFFILLAVLLSLAAQAGDFGSCEDFLNPPAGYRMLQIHAKRHQSTVPESYTSLKRAVGTKILDLQKHQPNYWLDLASDLPEVVPGVIAVQSDPSDLTTFQRCGTCKHMLGMHMRAFVIPMSQQFGHLPVASEPDDVDDAMAGKFAQIFVRGRLVGILKLAGSEGYRLDDDGFFRNHGVPGLSPIPNPTFLSLLNSVNKQGELTLALGGVYYVTQDFFSQVILPAVNAQGPFTSPQDFLNRFQSITVDVDQIELLPQTFLLTEDGYAHNRLLLERGLQVSEHMHDVGLSAYHQASWRRLRERLRQLRIDLSAGNHGP